jgi:hypothetical protein
MVEHLYKWYNIFLEYSKHLNEFALDGVVRPFLVYEMVQHISGIFQASESSPWTMSDPVLFHPGRV